MSNLNQRAHRRGLGCLPSLVLLLAFGLAVAVAVASIIGPWIYTVGGRHRWLPMWEGVGDAPGPGGTYRLYVWFAPSPSGQRILPETAVQGYSTLCTPRGQRLNLKLYGEGPGRAWLSMPDGHAFGFRVFRRRALGDVTGAGPVGPPRLTFEGRWQGADLSMTDRGTLAQAFNSDGTVVENGRTLRPGTGATAITFTESDSLWLSFPPCPRGR